MRITLVISPSQGLCLRINVKAFYKVQNMQMSVVSFKIIIIIISSSD